MNSNLRWRKVIKEIHTWLFVSGLIFVNATLNFVSLLFIQICCKVARWTISSAVLTSDNKQQVSTQKEVNGAERDRYMQAFGEILNFECLFQINGDHFP